MNDANSQPLLQHIRRLAGDPPGAPSDGELLRRYLERRDESAFAALVRRHGPMVFAVCQSVLRQRHDAEDAFQAAFLILARKADAVRRHEGLGGWLQRVAYRVALKARADNLRQRQREVKAARSAAEEPSSDDLSWGELRAILHRELAALPESLRAPLVLCYLEGRTQEEAARQLGWPLSTVRGRLQRGREKLRRRLERRSVALTAALGAALTGQALAETVVPSLTATTAATALAHAFLRPLLPIKLALLSAVLLSLGIVAGGVVLRTPAEPRPSGSGEQDRSLKVAARKDAVDAHGDPLPDGAVARLGTVRFNHGEGLNRLFFSPDGKTIISEGGGSICFWDARNGKELHRLHTDKISWLHPPFLLADGKTLVTRGAGDFVIFWDLAVKKRIRSHELPGRRNALSSYYLDSVSPDGKLCVMYMDNPATAHVQVSDLTTGKSLYRLANDAKTFLAVAFAGNDHLVSADDKNRLEVWEARTGKFLRRLPHDAPLRYLLASPDGRWLAGLDQQPSVFGRKVEQETVYLWDMKTGKAAQSFRAKPKRWFSNICFSRDGKSLLTSTQRPFDVREVVLWDSESGRRLLTFDAASGMYADIAAISPDGSRLAAAAGIGGYASKFELWDLKNGHRLTSEDSRHLYWLPSVVLAPAGDRATIIGWGSISSWDATSGRPLHSFDLPRDTLDSRSMSSDGRYAVTCRLEGEQFQVLIWDISARKILHTLRLPGGYQHITSAFAPDSSLLAISQPGKPTLVRLWDVQSGKQVRSFELSKVTWARHLQFTADGKTLFVAGQRVVAYEVASGKELFSWRLKPLPNTSGMRFGVPNVKPDEQIGWCSLAVSPDGARVAVVLVEADNLLRRGRLENRLALYDGPSGKLLRRWDDSGLPTPYFEKMAFSPDGQLLASSDVRAVHLWETATCKLIRTFQGHQADVCAVAFSRDGRRLASGDKEGSTVLIWDVTGQAAKPSDLTAAKLNECWNDLAGEDAGRAHRAVWTFIAAPRESVPFLKARLHPAKPVNREQIDRWIQALDAYAFEAREKATAELENLGELAEPALRRALDNKPTLEQRRRIEPILTKLDAAIPSGEILRPLRAVRVLDHAGTAEARRLLLELADGAEGAALTRAAQAALAHIARAK